MPKTNPAIDRTRKMASAPTAISSLLNNPVFSLPVSEFWVLAAS